MRRADSLEKTLMLGGIGSRRRKGWQRMRWLDGIADSMDVSLSELGSWWWTGRPGVLRFMGLQRVGHDWVIELDWTDWMTNDVEHLFMCFFTEKKMLNKNSGSMVLINPSWGIYWKTTLVQLKDEWWNCWKDWWVHCLYLTIGEQDGRIVCSKNYVLW